MSRSFALALPLMFLIGAGPCLAQSDPLAGPRDVPLGKARPFATLDVNGAFGSPAETLSFYVYWDKPFGAPDRQRGFAARRVARTGQTGAVVSWATSITCPGLEPLLTEMERIPTPVIDVPVLGPDRGSPSIVADGVIFQLWTGTPRWDGDATAGYGLQFSSNLGTPLAAWATAARKALADCWSDRQPDAG